MYEEFEVVLPSGEKLKGCFWKAETEAKRNIVMQTGMNEHASRYEEMAAYLNKNGINIYLSCKALMFGQNYNALKSEIQGELSQMGCTFMPGATNADWEIYITCIAREYNTVEIGGMKQYFVYVDANIIIEKTATGQRIYENAISEKGGHTHNYEQAARQAYRDISPKISVILKEQIQQ